MKTAEQIINELRNNDLLKGKEITEKSPYFLDAIDFYNQFPQYAELPANAVMFINASKKHKPVKVHEFTNGSLWFVGNFADQKNVPLASIGDWKVVDTWQADLIAKSKVIHEIA